MAGYIPAPRQPTDLDFELRPVPLRPPSRPPPPKYNIATLQKDADDVKGTVMVNVQKLLDRDEKLTNLEQKSEDLEAGANIFKRTSNRLKNRMCWQNCQANTKIIVVILILLAIIVIIVVASIKSRS